MTTPQSIISDLAKHTPGPWVSRAAPYGFDVLVLDKETDRALWIAPVHTPAFAGSPYYPSRPEVEANVRLIVAAPDLLAALSELLADIKLGAPAWADGALIANANRAVSKATGATQ